jgi:transposase
MSMSELDAEPEPVRRIEVFTGAGRRRAWSAAEKAAIVAESHTGTETVCAVARRHALTPQQLFTWRREARVFGPLNEPTMFVSALVDQPRSGLPEVTKPARRPRRRSKPAAIELEIGGATVRVGADAPPRTIAAVIRALEADA